MLKPLSNLKSIFNEAKLINTHQQFFPLLHEFSLRLMNNTSLKEGLIAIQAKEKEMKRWINRQMPHKPSTELKRLYFQQYQNISDWYALNQIRVFLERYDFSLHDAVIQDLAQNNIDSSQLTQEHSELMKYTITGVCPPIFPTIEEYKHYMRRIIDSLEVAIDSAKMAPNSSVGLKDYHFRFDQKSNALLIEGCKPITFTRNKNPSLLIMFLEGKKWKSITWTNVNRELGFEHDTTKRTIRQINDRIPASHRPFLHTPNHQAKLNEKIITVSGLYKKH